MTDEDKLHDWLMVGVDEGLRTVNFVIEEEIDDG